MPHTPNFLHSVEPPEEHAPFERRRKARRWVVVICVVLCAWAVVSLVAAGQVVSAALDGRDALVRARDAAVGLEFEAAARELAVADARFGAAERGFFILRPFELVPWVSGQLRAADVALVRGREMIRALGSVVELGAELVRLTGFSEEELRRMRDGVDPSVTFDDLPSDTKRAILERLAGSATDLEILAARIAILRSDLEDVESDGVAGPVARALGPVEARLAEAERTVRGLSVAASVLPSLAGLGETRTHLLLFLNNTELRPGGGFLGTFGILKTRDGDIAELETRDSYAFDVPGSSGATEPAPAPLVRYNAADRWYFRDANWSPDFPTSAEIAMRLYNAEAAALSPEARASLALGPEEFDGAIGVTPTLLSSLLALTGPLTVGGQTFDADNVTDKLEYQVEVAYADQGIPESQRKEVVADLVNALKARLFGMSASEWPAVLRVAGEAIAGRQLVLMNMDPRVQETLEWAGWSGAVRPGAVDTQMVVDANLASLKSDPSVSRDVRYEIFRNTSGQYVGRTTVTYSHNGTFDWKTTRYRTYVRLYVPAGSQLVRADGSMLNDRLQNPSGAPAPVDVAEELGLVSFGTFVSIEPGETRSLAFEYLLAESVVSALDRGTYALDVIKQVGSQNNQLTLDLDFGKNVTGASVPEDQAEWGDGSYRLNTKVDQNLEFVVEL